MAAAASSSSSSSSSSSTTSNTTATVTAPTAQGTLVLANAARASTLSKPTIAKPPKLTQAQSFAISSMAPAMAVVFTNPFDTSNKCHPLHAVMVGLLLTWPVHRCGCSCKVYKNSIDCMVKTYQHEGIRGLQKGLTPAILREGSKNLFRLGMFEPVMKILHDPAQGAPPAWKLILDGSICGVMGAAACNPFELIKTRLQSAAHGSIAVGHQHNYTGVWMALRTIVKNDGIKGLYRGSVMSMCRSTVGSGANLGAYNLIKRHLMHERHWADDVPCDMVAGMSSGFASVICMNPIDVLRTRYYNQPYGPDGKGLRYSSGIACAKQMVTNEGYSALYKGFWSHFMRIGPHFCLTFVFLGVMRRQLLNLNKGSVK